MKKPKACPCCGNEKLYTGPLESCVQGVQCNRYINKGCGLSLGRRFPEYMPRGVKTLGELKKRVLAEAIEAWNRRI